MSLLAKLEAVIYAAEEPVTLNQLASLFTEEALELAAELAADQSQADAQSEAAPQLVYAEPEAPAEDEAVPESETESAEAAAEEANAPSETEAAPAEADAAVEEPVDLAAEEKRLAKQRERAARNVIQGLIGQLIEQYASDERGIEIREVAGGYRVATKPQYHDAVRSFVKSLKPALKLSLPALETLAVIAYKQPVTAPEVNEIRGVESSGVFGSLLSRKLIATAGRKQVIGRPILYKTTREFLLRFGLKDLSELPSMEEFEKLAALELEEPEAAEAPAENEGELFTSETAASEAVAAQKEIAESEEAAPAAETDEESAVSAEERA